MEMNQLQPMNNFLTTCKRHCIKFFGNRIVYLFFGTGLVIVLGVFVYFQVRPSYQPPLVLTAEQIQQANTRLAELKNILIDYPEYYEVYLEAAGLERNLGNYDAAFKDLRKASKIVASSSIPWLNMSSYYQEIKQNKKAYDALWQAQAVSSDYYLVYDKIVDFYKWHYQQKQSEIPQVYELGISKTNDPHLVKAYADYLLDNNNPIEALKYYLQLQAYQPNNQEINEKVNQLKKQLGQTTP
jgi:tetratricopeptide (TPR) repeat protein